MADKFTKRQRTVVASILADELCRVLAAESVDVNKDPLYKHRSRAVERIANDFADQFKVEDDTFNTENWLRSVGFF